MDVSEDARKGLSLLERLGAIFSKPEKVPDPEPTPVEPAKPATEFAVENAQLRSRLDEVETAMELMAKKVAEPRLAESAEAFQSRMVTEGKWLASDAKALAKFSADADWRESIEARQPSVLVTQLSRTDQELFSGSNLSLSQFEFCRKYGIDPKKFEAGLDMKSRHPERFALPGDGRSVSPTGGK